MKKLILSILAVMYLGLSSGFSVHLHYCMDQFEGWDMELSHETSEDKCGNCGMPQNEDNACCSVEQKLLKLEDEQSNNFQTFNFIKSFSQAGSLPEHSYHIPVAWLHLEHRPSFITQSQVPTLALFKQYSNYRI